jgi:hypothetical protein
MLVEPDGTRVSSVSAPTGLDTPSQRLPPPPRGNFQQTNTGPAHPLHGKERRAALPMPDIESKTFFLRHRDAGSARTPASWNVAARPG